MQIKKEKDEKITNKHTLLHFFFIQNKKTRKQRGRKVVNRWLDTLRTLQEHEKECIEHPTNLSKILNYKNPKTTLIKQERCKIFLSFSYNLTSKGN
jgi:hypothetical protein